MFARVRNHLAPDFTRTRDRAVCANRRAFEIPQAHLCSRICWDRNLHLMTDDFISPVRWVMRAYSDMNTKRLEELARKVGVDCQIRTLEAQEDGRFFVFAIDDLPLRQPVPLGFTIDHAIHAINAGTWARYAMSGEPTTLATAPRRTGRVRKPARRRNIGL